MVGNLIKRLFFPQKCAGCGDIFPLSAAENDAFCFKCSLEWEKSKMRICPKCKLQNIDCICKSHYICEDERVNQISVTKFGICNQVDRLIYAIKKKNNERLFGFLTDELYKRLLSYGKSCNECYNDAVFTNVPRSKKSISMYGFDQSEKLARGLASKMGGEYEKLITRSGKSIPQKSQDFEERKENVRGKFNLSDKVNIFQKDIILVDDVVTTGATASECIKVMLDNGAKSVLLISIARTDFDKKRHKIK